MAQLAAASQSVLQSLPTGITPPSIIRYNASTVPILQLGLSSDTLSEQQLYDLGYNFIRTQLANVQGASFPLALRRQAAPDHGGPESRRRSTRRPLRRRGLRRHQLARASSCRPARVKIGAHEYNVKLNSAPEVAAAFNRLPVTPDNGTTVYVGDVAHVRDGYAVQTNIVRHNGRARRAADRAQERRRVHPRYRAAAQGRCCRASSPRCLRR